ncbi:methylmalonyl-CoA mutase [bacterium (Candidatus Blackallbacteria) CG17_big_fil_post_rev_8_21_14_2_50_48_46]|uniref:Fused isobutyryl-CoA mutase n=1 Tax=bacterium (Candidatus Blackallbacteria) CG17_big_fil_post_rev_8_21_14_2_50_48_46 TaxID=2014261 RepID=A0A2M7GA81_9BACT|nr:MAG: methylmalonyl-CoA mutase [bacterium (Candidatus Blackallbacteria) CG18_big_fil_WC_8_21_14_2_50_49_26]PIW19052.1 MAG: methylmalonyl-CoA mutase [bacterium (Candidatus Blackallbacteria) CG17_big_fil_post_rev_8_21_14_2_50_48_46]PIW44581.1 MAG: methylmalonyl-CoA mutase [bacterium (Candidatus Blackallbacteria) CG13_big_fil_rev_8_21_14_2_50_49_14]
MYHAPEREAYIPQNPIRLVTAASLFDGHDAAINIMRRILQMTGAEVIHLGHNRSVAEIVDCAIQEDVQGIAVTSYQGGHLEYFKYMYDLLQEKGAGHIRIFGGGGGTILPSEIQELHAYGIARIYSPDDGRELGLQGMINDLLEKCDFATTVPEKALHDLQVKSPLQIGQLITLAENHPEAASQIEAQLVSRSEVKNVPVVGITGTGGAGKSSLVDELVHRFLRDFPNKTLAIVSVDPTRRKSGGALLGDRIRMNSIHNPRVYMRSLATRQSNLALSRHVRDALLVCKAAAYDLILLESSGIGQSDTEIIEHSDLSLYVMTSDYGAASQLEKIDMIDFADLIAINKFDKSGSLDALRDVRKQYRRNRNLFQLEDEALPVIGTMASQFNDPGVNQLYKRLMERLNQLGEGEFSSQLQMPLAETEKIYIIPPERTRYLAEIADEHLRYQRLTEEQSTLARQLFQLQGSLALLPPEAKPLRAELEAIYADKQKHLSPETRNLLDSWPEIVKTYTADELVYHVRQREIRQPLYRTSLSQSKIPRVALPKTQDWGDLLKWRMTENLPGEFPYTAGVFPLKREGEDPTRMFAGEGGPERTNRRFHYVSLGMPAKRLSTAFDSVTLYGEDPDPRPDIYGKVGNSGVSIATLDDAKKLYSGFDLCHPNTSVSMTINGPAPMLLAFYMNVATDQLCEKYIHENSLEAEVEAQIEAIYAAKGLPRPRYQGDLPEGNDGLGLFLLGVTGDQVLPAEVYQRLRAEALSSVRGTVQADILKEDQAQNTCIFSTEFALRMMGDIQQYFTDHRVKNFYSVSISGYHIAEAGANPISQLAFTLANGFTFVEYYLSRGMKIDDFAPNLSFFFSNGVDPEYAVIGRVARRIWAKAIKHVYGGNDRSQKLKYHIQTSGRSLHAQEIAFNDIRTTLQALYAIYDNCNSLHTNAYDEAITTPTEESVRRAMAIQLIINHELGLAKNENPLQGAFIIEELTDLVEEAVMAEFRRISERGGVLGAMERQYQRFKIQEESLYYEHQKLSGELPLIGVNTFLGSDGSPTLIPNEVIRATPEEKEYAISSLQAFQARNVETAPAALKTLQETAIQNGNLFETLMESAKICSLGQMSGALYEVGGQYRRNM